MSIRADDLSLARLEAARARGDLDDLRRRAVALGAATSWRARAADAYRAAAEAWIDDVDRLLARVDRFDDSLAAGERAARIRDAGLMP